MFVNFWHNLPKPIFCLAPMEEVTDFAFREMFARYSGQVESKKLKVKSQDKSPRVPLGLSSSGDRGEPSAGNSFVMFTEFVNVDGLLHPEGFKKLSIDLKYSEAQRPMVAQIWGRDPEKFFRVAKLIAELKFDGIDINMGCPQSKEIAGGTCAALIREPKLAQEIIQATKEGAIRRTLSASDALGISPRRGEGSAVLPVSVKTRLGYSKTDEMEGWVRNLLEMDLAALTLHARTKQEMSKVPPHWDLVAEAVQVRDKMQETRDKDSRTLIIGNGDIKSRQEGLARIAETGCDGVMVGRGAFGHPWFFAQPLKNLNAGALRSLGEGGFDDYQPSVKERLRVMLEHAELFDQTFSGPGSAEAKRDNRAEAGKKSFAIMRKHFKAYASGFDGAHELRAKLMETKNLHDTQEIVKAFIESTN